MSRRYGMPAWAMNHIRHETKDPSLIAHDRRAGLYPHARAIGALSQFRLGALSGKIAETYYFDFTGFQVS
jgi:hypothetical protein